MHRRWYDQLPTVSMAVSLLQNLPMSEREKIVAYLTDRICEIYPQEASHFKAHSKGLLWIFQKRNAMDDAAWHLLELLHHLSERDRDEMALEIIHLIYCLENETFIHKYEAASA